MRDLTTRQREVLAYVTDYVDEHGYPPTIREIQHHLDLASPSTVHNHVLALVRKGHIEIVGSRRLLKVVS